MVDAKRPTHLRVEVEPPELAKSQDIGNAACHANGGDPPTIGGSEPTREADLARERLRTSTRAASGLCRQRHRSPTGNRFPATTRGRPRSHSGSAAGAPQLRPGRTARNPRTPARPSERRRHRDSPRRSALSSSEDMTDDAFCGASSPASLTTWRAPTIGLGRVEAGACCPRAVVADLRVGVLVIAAMSSARPAGEAADRHTGKAGADGVPRHGLGAIPPPRSGMISEALQPSIRAPR